MQDTNDRSRRVIFDITIDDVMNKLDDALFSESDAELYISDFPISDDLSCSIEEEFSNWVHIVANLAETDSGKIRSYSEDELSLIVYALVYDENIFGGLEGICSTIDRSAKSVGHKMRQVAALLDIHQIARCSKIEAACIDWESLNDDHYLKSIWLDIADALRKSESKLKEQVEDEDLYY